MKLKDGYKGRDSMKLKDNDKGHDSMKLKGNDMPESIARKPSKFCSVYVISKGKQGSGHPSNTSAQYSSCSSSSSSCSSEDNSLSRGITIFFGKDSFSTLPWIILCSRIWQSVLPPIYDVLNTLKRTICYANYALNTFDFTRHFLSYRI
jgi:hypothetical protein